MENSFKVSSRILPPFPENGENYKRFDPRDVEAHWGDNIELRGDTWDEAQLFINGKEIKTTPIQFNKDRHPITFEPLDTE